MVERLLFVDFGGKVWAAATQVNDDHLLTDKWHQQRGALLTDKGKCYAAENYLNCPECGQDVEIIFTPNMDVIRTFLCSNTDCDRTFNITTPFSTE